METWREFEKQADCDYEENCIERFIPTNVNYYSIGDVQQKIEDGLLTTLVDITILTSEEL